MRYHAVAALVVLAVALAAPARANDSIGGLIPGESVASRHSVMSMRERRFAGVVQQQTDFSCGAAVLATLFRYAYGAKVGEPEVLAGLLNTANPAIVRERGFSLLDLKNYSSDVGLTAEGYEVALPALKSLKVPGIVLMDVRGYHHFVLLRHVDQQYAYVADPALGNRTVPLGEFLDAWNGLVLVVLGKGYREGNPLVTVSPPLGASQLLAGAPVTATPAALSTMIFDGVPGVQRI